MYWAPFDSPVGELTIVGDERGVAAIYMDGQRHRPAIDATWVRDIAPLRDGIEQLAEYFRRHRREFDMRIVPITGTAFQRRVWEELRQIPFGETTSYGELAAAIGRPTAARAVGMANGRNPVSIVVPCHRVIGAGGSLTGYGGGIDRKRWLLDFESDSVTVPS